MAIKGQSIVITYRAWDTSANAYKTGDVANHSISIIKDGGARAATTNSPSEVDATNMPGVYKLTLTAADMTANVICVAGKSSTANIVLLGFSDIVTEQGVLPGGTTANGVGGLPVLDANSLIDVDVKRWLAVAPNALVSGRVDASAGALAANVITASAINAAALNGKGDWLLSSSYVTPPTTAQIATGVWQDITAGDFTVALSVGKSLMNGVSLGTGLHIATVDTATNLTNAPTAGDLTATMKTSVQTAADAAITANALVLEIEADTDTLTAGVIVTTNDDKTGYSLAVAPPTATAIFTSVLTTQMTESYAADNVAPTLAQILFLIQQAITEFSIAGTTKTIKKLDGSTTAATETLNDATTPTAITRTT